MSVSKGVGTGEIGNLIYGNMRPSSAAKWVSVTASGAVIAWGVANFAVYIKRRSVAAPPRILDQLDALIAEAVALGEGSASPRAGEY